MRGSPVFRSRSLPWLLLLPTILILLLFLYFPVIQSFVLSLYRSNLFLGTQKYIGIENFRNIFTGVLAPGFRQVLLQTVLFSGVVVLVGLSVSLALAVLANQPVRGSRIYRLLLIWPFALSPAVAGTIFLFMFNPEVGVINQLLNASFGIKPRWLDTPQLAFAVVSMAAIWKNLGYNIVFYLAALQNVPAELGEAAQIDGATAVQRFFAVTLPLLSPMTFFLVFTNLVYAFFDTFGLIDILTAGGPVGSPPFDQAGVTSTLIYKIYQDGFGGAANLGFAAAESVVLLALVALVTVMQFRFGSRRVYYGGA
ncbi:MAG TPA: sugar ABC transporter permease [Trueperaceae bacterium]|nr:sugar ABC transporter permease [Trueperaceae bacterium]HRP45918.1 sugar ABC transporter permease [Trueperaceae bacterium]